MKNSYRAILVIFLSLIILGGLALFIFRVQALDWLRVRSDLGEPLIAVNKVITVPASESLDLSILKMPQFIALTNQVINFDFDNICRNSVTTPVKTGVTIVTTGTSTPPVPTGCVQGNNLPFFKKK